MSVTNVKRLKKLVFLGNLISHSNEDAAKTQTFVSGSKLISEKNVHGEFWEPHMSWVPIPGIWMKYQGCGQEKLKPHASNPDEWEKFWVFCEDAVKKVGSDKTNLMDS
jgi:hypothetical protein